VGTISLYVIRQVYDGPYGKDFTMFLTGAHMLTDGQGSSLYDLDAQGRVQAPLKGPVIYPGGVLPFNYPPFMAAFLSPLTLLTPEIAYYAWLVVQFLVLLVLVLSIVRLGFGAYALPLVMLFTFAPIIEALLMGQLSLVLLLLWWWAFLSWRSGNWVALGVAVSLAAFKPQMVVLLVVALVVQKMWRALAVAAGVQAFLWGAAVLFFGPGILVSYLNILKLSGTTTGTLGFYPYAMPNLRGLLTALGAGPDLGLLLSLAAWVLSIGAVAWLWYERRSTDDGLDESTPIQDSKFQIQNSDLALRFGVTAVLAVIFSPHLYIHDAALLMIAPLCLYVAALEKGKRVTVSDGEALRVLHWLLVPFTALFVSIYLLVLRLVPSYTPLIISMLFCGGVMLYLLRQPARRDAHPAQTSQFPGASDARNT
jgi:hypothetical protein